MGVWILSPDVEAAGSLCSVFQRHGVTHQWDQTATEPPPWTLVAVIDAEVGNHSKLRGELRRSLPWCRCYLLTSEAADCRSSALETTASELSGTPSETQDTNTKLVTKPFDAAGLAQLVQREAELAALDRTRRQTEVRADELALLVQSTFEAIIGLDSELTILSWNGGATATYGYEATEVLGKPIGILYESAERKSPPFHLERRAAHTLRRHKDGHQLSVLVSRSRVAQPPPGSELAFSEVSLDVTQQQRLEHDLQQSQRLATLGRISATMSHEINNPLAVIRSCAAWLKDFANKADNDELYETSDDLELASERIGGFVDQMCGLARRAPTELSREPLSKTLEVALRMVRPRAINKGVDLRVVDAHIATLPIDHDRARLSQAIINVVANAVDAAAEGGRQVWVRIVPQDTTVQIEVQDNGPGVAPEMRDQLFEPFSTTKPFGHGTGLGLALTREVLAEHHGSVRLVARPTGGTIAELQLPRTLTKTPGEKHARRAP